jgi:hypothetical protein
MPVRVDESLYLNNCLSVTAAAAKFIVKSSREKAFCWKRVRYYDLIRTMTN